MEEGDETALADWRMWRELSVKKYEHDYDRLNVHFDAYTGESQVSKQSQDAALTQLEQMGIIEDHEGAKLVNLTKYKLERAVVRKKGASVPPACSRRLTPLRRRDVHLPHARHRRRDGTLRKVQV